MRNIRFTIGYDGTHFSGWQIQSTGTRTVQGEFEAALARMAQRDCRLRVTGRTDAGVHAHGQIANWHTESTFDARRLKQSLTGLLPSDIWVSHVEEVPLEFDSRRDSKGKHYRYSIYRGQSPHAMHTRYAHHHRGRLQLMAMVQAATSLVGTHDFGAFRAADCERETTVRTIHRATLTTNADHLYIDIHGTAFLKHMIRIIAGTLLDIGSGKLPADRVVELLAAPDRTRAGITAPAHGLCLERVFLK